MGQGFQPFRLMPKHGNATTFVAIDLPRLGAQVGGYVQARQGRDRRPTTPDT
jgi:hypothetical protein